jgi:hypothetical protein
VWDEYKQEEFHIRALLFVTINDWPADEVLTRQMPMFRAFDSWRERGRLADSTASDRNRGTHEFTQVRPPGG